MKEILRPALSLCIITLVAAICLGATYGVTREPIAREKERTQTLAMQEVLPSATEFKSEEVSEDGPESIVTSVLTGYNAEGVRMGYALGVAPKGYAGTIEILVGIDIEGDVQGISFLKHNETPGLGANADSDAFKNQFTGKKGPFKVTKSAPSDQGNEIEAITSATITSHAVSEGVNSALSYFSAYLEEAKP